MADPLVQVADELVEDLLLAGEVEVEGALRDPGRLGDLHDRGVVVAGLCEAVLGGVDQTAARGLALLRERPPVDGGRQHLGHATTSSDFCTLPIEFRGSSSTRWNDFGTLKRASRSRANSASSSSGTSSRRTTNAAQTSPHRSSG